MAAQHAFSTILNQAIQSSGLSLTYISNELKKQGMNVSTASLSYWKTGKSLPTRKSSRPILAALETMCSLTPGTLIQAAQSDSKANRDRYILNSSSRTRVPNNAHAQVPSESEDLESNIQWDYEAEREIIIDSHHISADFMQIQSQIMILARIANTARSHLHISSYVGADDEQYADSETGLRYLEGAVIGDIIRHKDSRAITLRLDLSEERKVGELHRVFYLPAPFYPTSPCTVSPNRHLAWPLRMYNCSVTFEGDVPNKIEWVTEKTQEKHGARTKQITAQRVQPSGNTVQISLENIQGIMGYFRWTL